MGLALLLLCISLVALFSVGLSWAPREAIGAPSIEVGACASSGVLPNPVGDTGVTTTSVWCGGSFKTYNVSVGSSFAYVSLTISNASIEIKGNWTVNSPSKGFKSVNLTIDNSTIWLTRTASRLLVDLVRNSSSILGSSIVIKNSYIQGNVTDVDAFPLGVHIQSGWDGSNWYRLARLQISGTRFKNLGNYWGYGQAALDTKSGSSWSRFASGSFARNLNFTNPFGMNGSPPASNPWAVEVGDSLPIESSSFFGGYMGTTYSKYVFNNTFFGVCRDTYVPLSYAVIRGNSYNDTGQGSGCKDIDFFQPDITFTDNFLYGTGINAGDASSGDNYVGNSTFVGRGPGCNGYAVHNVTFNNLTIYQTELDSRCNSPRITNVRVSYDLSRGVGGYGGLTVEPHPYDIPSHTPYDDAYVWHVSASNCSIYFDYQPEHNACFSLSHFANSHVNYVNVSENPYPGQAVYLDNLTNTVVANLTAWGCYVCVYFGPTMANSLVIDNASFPGAPTLADYYVNRTGGVTIKNQVFWTWTVKTGWYPGYLTWEWTNLLGNQSYKIQRSTVGSTSSIQFNTTASGAGGALIVTPANATATYTLLTSSPDQLASPAPILDLQARPNGPGAWNLTWTATGDHASNGTAYRYEVRYSDQGNITDSTWDNAWVYPQSWMPRPSGSGESHLITGFDPNATYWVAVRAANEYRNWSGISNAVILSPQALYATFARIEVVPAHLQLRADESSRFSALAYDTHGLAYWVIPRWTTSNGTVASDGLFTPWSVGNWTVCAWLGSLFGCSQVTVVPGSMARLSLHPLELDVAVGQSVVLEAAASDAKLNPVSPVVISWTVNPSRLGTIESGSVFVAREEGQGEIQAFAVSGNITLASSISIVISSHAGIKGGSILENFLVLGLIIAVVGGILAATAYSIKGKSNLESQGEVGSGVDEPFSYECGNCGSPVGAKDVQCSRCGARFEG